MIYFDSLSDLFSDVFSNLLSDFQVERLVAEVSAVAEVSNLEAEAEAEAGAEVQVGNTAPSDDSDIVVLSSEEDAPRLKADAEQGELKNFSFVWNIQKEKKK